MKITTWNCAGALRKKFHLLRDLDSDIYIIQECENPSQSNDFDYKNWAKNHLWIGDSIHKGLGIFANIEIKLERLNWTNTFKDNSVKYFLPCKINNSFQLLGVWTHRNNSPNFGYIGQFWKYLQTNLENFEEIIIGGDFNSNVIWDQWDRWWNHSDVVKTLEEKGIKSLYHEFFNERQGDEKNPTFYHRKNLNKPYHIDYIFGSFFFHENLIKVEILDQKIWIHHSDHIPVSAIFQF
ncbi:endonuclease/exonuclease/phosphatase family protein [Algoriphagus kandeliae]|uniref:Endonuclease/exonuclease/phosphatase family protein n=1 Tax=Algoriphagus kandeliae TaxID=2562278 RepID=A0A4Y9QXE9_9BACT|nr:endonuclease/exonuclease/phosphatase family protein [Algoriphagus kandeliae]TFV97111.1 endonuclease/exonuclease/phosphatase family protein [Algoriphagus kandeliae]